jgi:hypothetical protein
MKKLPYFTFIFVLSFVINILSHSNSEAMPCITNVDGAIELSDTAIAGGQVKIDDDLAPFKYVNNQVDEENFNTTDACSAEPDFYKMTIYKVGLCKQDPYVLNEEETVSGNPRLESCVLIVNNDDGKEVVIEKGKSTNSLLEGEEIIIPTGEYPYFVMILSNHLHVKHIQEYNDDDKAAVTMYGLGSLDGSGNVVSAKTGEHCYTKAVVTTYSGMFFDTSTPFSNTFENDHSVDVVSSGNGTTFARMHCTSDLATAQANVAYATEIIDHFGEHGDIEVASHIPWEDKENIMGGVETDVSLIGVEMASNLLQDNNATLATTFSNAKRIAMFIHYTELAPRISENTVSLKLNISTSDGISIDSNQDINGSTNVVQTWMAKVGVDPFTVVVQVQNQDPRGARGAFR